jgi:hypothetical protein
MLLVFFFYTKQSPLAAGASILGSFVGAKDGGQFFIIVFILLVSFLFLESSSVIEKQIKLLTNLSDWLDFVLFLVGSRSQIVKLYQSS